MLKVLVMKLYCLTLKRMIVPEEFSSATSTVVWDQDGTQNFDEDPWDAGDNVPNRKRLFYY